MVEPMRRSYLTLNVALAAMFILLAGGLYRVQILDGSKYRELAKDNRERTITVKAGRGIIYDRNGVRLVVNNPKYSIAITPADVPDINCASGGLESQVKDAAVFDELAGILDTKNIIVVRPVDLPFYPEDLSKDKVGDVANRLSVLLQTPADSLRAPLHAIMSGSASSDNLFPVRADVSAEVAAAVRAKLDELPGIQVFNELELNFLTRFGNCLRPINVKSNVEYDTMQRVEMEHSKLQG